MKFIKIAMIWVVAPLLLSAQTQDLGSYVFFNQEGAINVAADAGVAARNLDSPYLMFVLYLGMDPGMSATVNRDDVVMVFNDKEYPMPSFKEFRKNYDSDRRDWDLYTRLGKEALALSEMRYYRFQVDADFFPAQAQRIRIADEGYMSSQIGFRTKVYFKNPGLKEGDIIVIKLKDKKNPMIWGAVAVEL